MLLSDFSLLYLKVGIIQKLSTSVGLYSLGNTNLGSRLKLLDAIEEK